jgi:hypothetical protein
MSTGDRLGSIGDDGCGSGAVGAAAGKEGPRDTGVGTNSIGVPTSIDNKKQK